MNYEYLDQCAIVQELRSRYPDVLFNADCGGIRTSWTQAKKAKASGHQKGFPDIFIYKACSGFHGLAIELKTAKTYYSKKGSPSPEQKAWREKLILEGYKAEICFGRDEAMSVIDNYLRKRNDKL